MKFWFILLTLLLSISLVSAETVYDKYTYSGEIITLNNLDYEFIYSFNSDKAVIQSKYSKTLVSLYDCANVGYLEFCLTNITQETEKEDTQIKLIIEEEDCINYLLDNGSHACKVKIGEECETDYECVGTCLHNFCTLSYPVCGDSYCDKNEKCNSDCTISINETNTTNITEETINTTAIEAPIITEITNTTIETINTTQEPKNIIEEPKEISDENPFSEITKRKDLSKKDKLIIWITIPALILSFTWIIYNVIKKKNPY